MRFVAGLAGLALMTSSALAEDVPVETATLGKSAVTLHIHPFLKDDELATLRLVATNEQALALFVPSQKGFAAMALSPDDGLIRDGQPVPSAIALADLPDAETARLKAAEACDKARSGKKPCVVVLEVSPAK